MITTKGKKMATKNGNKTLMTVLTIIGLMITAFIVISSLGTFHGKESATVQYNTDAIEEHTDAIKANSKDIRLNTDHRIADSKDSEFFGKRFDRIEKNLDDFSAEQREVNKEILKRLPR